MDTPPEGRNNYIIKLIKKEENFEKLCAFHDAMVLKFEKDKNNENFTKFEQIVILEHFLKRVDYFVEMSTVN